MTDRATISITVSNDGSMEKAYKIKVVAHVVSPLVAYHESQSDESAGFVVTHIPTGYKLVPFVFSEEGQAQAAARLCARVWLPKSKNAAAAHKEAEGRKLNVLQTLVQRVATGAASETDRKALAAYVRANPPDP